jgi:uncharacterized protein (TIGR02246 family)
MSLRWKLTALLLLGAGALLGYAAATGGHKPARTDDEQARAAGEQPVEKGREADDAAIRQAAREFEAAFNKGDATAVAALWTDQGECHDAAGEAIRGRPAIEQAYADLFRQHPGIRAEVRVVSVRFPGADVAVEDGVLRLTHRGELPTTTVYSTTHVREGGRWRVAVSKEWGAGQDRIEDVDWLVGTWKAAGGDHEVTLTLTREADRPVLNGRYARLVQGKVVTSGTMRIALDAQTGQLRSWHFDDDGGHGQALWARDGNNWILDSVGVLADGTETAAVNIIGRVGDDVITWRSIDRVAGDKELPNTVPLRLTRVPAAK